MNSRRAVAVLFSMWLSLAATVEPQAPEPFQISVNVDLVVLNATVRDRKGGFAPKLRQADFGVYEDGVRQTIRLFLHEDVPVTVGLVVDHSGSMRGKLGEVIVAARTFVRASNQDDQMFVVNFNEKATFGLPAALQVTNRAEELSRAILNTPATGKTALYDAVVKALERLQSGNRDKKALIVISDGGDNASEHRQAEVLRMVEQSSAVVYTIGLFDADDPDRNPGVLKRLARATGGEAFFPQELNEIVAICEQIARDIRNQYTIGYLSNAVAAPDAYRKIRVAVKTGGTRKFAVRSRAGYFAGPARK